MKILRKIIEIDEELCNGCGKCVPGCAEGALQIIEGKARVMDEQYCDGLGACLGECPLGALRIVEREVTPFAEKAAGPKSVLREIPVLPCGCPSANIQNWSTGCERKSAGDPACISKERVDSSLTHWPVQIRLIPASAPFLKGADLLVLADCAAVALPDLHRDLLKGKTVMMGCPKFDDVLDYTARFSAIFKSADIKSITTVVMEVPCCSGLPLIVKKGLVAADKDIPLEEIVVSTRGQITCPPVRTGVQALNEI